MITTHTFSNASINLQINPFSVYVLIDKGENLKSREILRSIERRKTVTGNIFSVRAVRKDLVVGGKSRKALKESIGNANIFARVLYPESSSPQYLCANIEFNPDNIELSANQIRLFIQALCVKDIESIKENCHTYLISAKKELLNQLSSLEHYLSKEILKSGYTPLQIPKKPVRKKNIQPIRSTFRNGLPNSVFGLITMPEQPISARISEPDYYEEEDALADEKVSFAKKTLIKVLSDLGLSYDSFTEKMDKARQESIVNIKDTTLSFVSFDAPQARYPGLQLKINNSKTTTIKIGTKAGCILYGSILFSLYLGREFKRSDLSDVAKQIKKKYDANGRRALSDEDKKSIPLLSWFEGIYKAVLGNRNGTFVHWCIEEYKDRTLDTAATLLKTNIEDTLTGDFEEFKDLLLIKKTTIMRGDKKSPSKLYRIDFPINQVDFPDDRWGDLKKAALSSPSPSSKNQTIPE